ncbi:MAG TPA: carboxypeptidase-like regulatory domain-containing protein, partial [Gemmatimonadaceae bacterium]
MRLSRLARTIAVAGSAIAALAVASPAHAQGTAVIRGTVVDSTNQREVPNAQVALVGTTLGAMSNAAGAFVITRVPAGSFTLRVQRIGYQPATATITVAAGDTAVVRVAMAPSAVQLSAVVSVGYGEESRRDVSAAVATVDNEEIQGATVAGVDAALQGKAAGVQIIQNAGNPGNGITVRIRGNASISASNQPLWVVDGIPLQRDSYSQLGIGGQDITGVTGLNPDEIESITVLKDAAAAAIYGSRGSNGVVMVTTKRGRAGTTAFTVNAYTGVQDVPKSTRWDMLNASEYIEYMNEAASNDGYGDEYFGDPNDPNLVNTDWQDEVMRSAQISDLSLGVSGGTELIQYYASGSYFDQDGVIIGSAYKRASGRV